MGLEIINAILSEDYATPYHDTVMRFHIDYPIPAHQVSRLRQCLQSQDWEKVANLLSNIHPSGEPIITDLISHITSAESKSCKFAGE